VKPRVFFIPVITLPLGDGTYRVAPGKPVERLTMEQACQMTGLHPRDLREAVEEGDLHAYRPRPRRWWFFAEEIDAFLRFTMDHPDFWRQPKTRLLWRKCNPFKLPTLPSAEGDGNGRIDQGDFFR
jgi:excisionase family DNA binding protein